MYPNQYSSCQVEMYPNQYSSCQYPLNDYFVHCSGPEEMQANSTPLYYLPETETTVANYDYTNENNNVWSPSYTQPPPYCYAYDNLLYSHNYDQSTSNIENGWKKISRKDSITTLKSWLQEHKENPYPSKQEKIILAVSTQMTFNQISTWFANARRRLKKEGKMTWVPKPRGSFASCIPVKNSF